MLTGLVLEQGPEELDLDRLRNERREQRLRIGLDLVGQGLLFGDGRQGFAFGGVKGSSVETVGVCVKVDTKRL